jgi:hypothetical protein
MRTKGKARHRRELYDETTGRKKRKLMTVTAPPTSSSYSEGADYIVDFVNDRTFTNAVHNNIHEENFYSEASYNYSQFAIRPPTHISNQEPIMPILNPDQTPVIDKPLDEEDDTIPIEDNEDEPEFEFPGNNEPPPGEDDEDNGDEWDGVEEEIEEGGLPTQPIEEEPVKPVRPKPPVPRPVPGIDHYHLTDEEWEEFWYNLTPAEQEEFMKDYHNNPQDYHRPDGSLPPPPEPEYPKPPLPTPIGLTDHQWAKMWAEMSTAEKLEWYDKWLFGSKDFWPTQPKPDKPPPPDYIAHEPTQRPPTKRTQSVYYINAR